MTERRHSRDRRHNHHGHYAGQNRRSEQERRYRRFNNPKLSAFLHEEACQGRNIDTKV